MANTKKNSSSDGFKTEDIKRCFASSIQNGTLSIMDRRSKQLLAQVKMSTAADSLTNHMFALTLMNEMLRYQRQVDMDIKRSRF